MVSRVACLAFQLGTHYPCACLCCIWTGLVHVPAVVFAVCSSWAVPVRSGFWNLAAKDQFKAVKVFLRIKLNQVPTLLR